LLRLGHYSTGRRSYAGAVAKVDDAGTGAVWAALDELYGVDASEFVAARKRLAAELRAAGDGDAAKAIGAARRPTNAAWAMNQLVRRDADVLTAFLERSRELATAQQAALAGDRDALRTATRAHRQAMMEAVETAAGFLGAATSETMRTQILTTLEAATRDPATADALRVGRLTREADVASGFTTDLETSTTPAAQAPKARPKLHLVPDEDEVRRRRAELESAISAAEAEVERASVALEATEQAAASAEERIAHLSDELADAQRERRDAAKELRDARKTANGVATRLDRLRRELD
jgi:hypothetical protein